MAPSVSYCIACNDDDEDVVYKCKGKGGACSYQLCLGCVKLSFDDMSGANSSFCALCKHPSALDMISAVCGKGAIQAVEQKFRNKVEFQVKEQLLKRDASRSTAMDISEQARKLFNELSERLNLKCPRCKAVFNDYDGCNALSCGVPSCKAAFCAICLVDCGHDAHAHVLKAHGDYFDKDAFERSKSLRAKSEIDKLMASLSEESVDLQQLVRNHIDKAKLLNGGSDSSNASWKTAEFLQKAKDNLSLAVRTDRLALLSNPEEYNMRAPINRDAVSPRCVVPRNYRLRLVRLGEDLFRILLEHQNTNNRQFGLINDVEAHFKDNPKVEALVNVSQSLQCAVIAFEGRDGLFQSSRAGKIPKGHRMADNEVCISMRKINRDGNVTDDELQYAPDLSVIGLNPNRRMLLLESHVERTPDKALMFEPLQHLIGVSTPRAVITELDDIVPESQSQLNEQQQQVADPKKLKTAMEVAGPPGTGKTKTIVELVRALLRCTTSDILVLSERNGAINAIADKFKKESIKTKGTKAEIIDLEVWMSVLAYGSPESIGESTKLFTVKEKIERHPDMTDLKEKRDLLAATSKNLSKALRCELSNIVISFGRHFDEDYYAGVRSREILEDTTEFTSPQSIIGAVKDAALNIKSLFDDRDKINSPVEMRNKGSKYLAEKGVFDVVVRHSILLSRLISIRTEKEREDKTSEPWDAKEATKRLRFILDRLTSALDLCIFSSENATNIYNETAAAGEAITALRKRLETELPQRARLHIPRSDHHTGFSPRTKTRRVAVIIRAVMITIMIPAMITMWLIYLGV